jgi:radical SAM protein with 4Fe4S-binding SPASM domain
MGNFNGLTNVNVELSSRCNANCWMCGRRKIERDYPDLANWGDMDFTLIEKIAKQLPEDIIVQFHNNGEGILHPRFGEAVRLFEKQIKSIDTNGKLIIEKADEIIDNLDTLTISIFENNPEAEEQYGIIRNFLKIKGDKKPLMIYRCLGDVDLKRYQALGGIVVTRILHNPLGSFGYTKPPTIPETGICEDALSHMAIDRFGKVSMCVRFDPLGLGVLGDANTTLLEHIWNGSKRRGWLNLHKQGRRKEIPLCQNCDFWGIPTSK